MGRLSEVFRRDHRRQEQLLNEVRQHVAARELDAARPGFASFRQAMEKHMAVEERCLFPAVEADDGPASRPLCETLRKGHRDLGVFFDELDDALSAQDAEEFARTSTTIQALLRLHDEKEEEELYPAAEARLDDDGAAALMQLAAR